MEPAASAAPTAATPPASAVPNPDIESGNKAGLPGGTVGPTAPVHPVEQLWHDLMDRGAPERPRWVLWLVAVLVTLVQMGPDWINRYRPDDDESYAMFAAVRLWQGHGLTFDGYDRLEDIAGRRIDYFNTWPPLFALVMGGLLTVTGGFAGAIAALHVIKALAALLGTYGWLRLGDRYLPAGGSMLFMLLTAAMNFAAYPNHSHLFCWALMPWVLSSLVRGMATGETGPLMRAGFLTAVSIGIRYSALPMIPAGGLALLLAGRGTLLERFLAGVKFATLPSVASGLIFGANLLFFGQAVRPENAHSYWTVDNVIQPEALKFPFAKGFELDTAIYKLRPSWYEHPHLNFWRLFPPWYVWMAGTVVAAGLAGCLRFGPSARRLMAAGALQGVFLHAMLMWLALRLPPDWYWNPAASPRYFSDVAPVVGLMWLMVLYNVVGVGRPRPEPEGPSEAGSPPSEPPPHPAKDAAQVASDAPGSKPLPDAASPVVVTSSPDPRGSIFFRPAWVGAMVIITVATAVGCRFLFRDAWPHAKKTIALLKGERFDALESYVKELIASAGDEPHLFVDTTLGIPKDFRWTAAYRQFPMTKGSEIFPDMGSSRRVLVITTIRWFDEDPVRKNYDTDYGLEWPPFLGLPKVAEIPDDGQVVEVFAGWVPAFKPMKETGLSPAQLKQRPEVAATLPKDWRPPPPRPEFAPGPPWVDRLPK